MYILIFFILVAITQYITNKILNISDDNTVGYTYSKRDSLIILLLLAIGILLQCIKLQGKVFWISCGIFAGSILITMIVLATIKKVIIEKQREELQQVFDVLTPVLPKNIELDYNNPPFKLGYEKHQINRITIEINPNTFKDTVAINLCLSLNKYLPNYEWVNEFDFASRECIFIGTPLPPRVAKYKGSWLRPAEFIPIGLSGLGEVSWHINSFKDAGRSNYVYEDGKLAKTVDTPSAPQALCVGSPLGLNTIIPTTNGYKTIETIDVGDYVFDLNNNPVKVLGKSEVFLNHNIYKLKFNTGSKSIIIIADEEHKFPVINNYVDKMYENIMVKDMNINDRVLANNSSYNLYKKEPIKTQPVQCILVDSDSHLFLITDKKYQWNGGQSYPYEAIYTRNTGGGKAIYVDQEIEVQDKL